MSSPKPQTKPSNNLDLSIFVTAQNKRRDGFLDATQQLLNGEKRSHWVWYIFPQIQGLSESKTSRKFAIQSLDHARDYLEHDVLGYRLGQAVRILRRSPVKDIDQLMGTEVDALKLHACMTLFQRVAKKEDKGIFQAILDKYYEGEEHEKTVQILLDLDQSQDIEDDTHDVDAETLQ